MESGKIIKTFFANNTRARVMYESLDFKLAGMIPGMFIYKGEPVGEVIYYLPLK